ncbi:hypothetical protein P3T76_006277 [Phytophthora citrophthora]|uniref:RxLR effector protein n=1 Tax=Phytophthora citrophthora TaxID=4793 RepID=A0AAD9GP02_9STRA|nr:hypothetical protein P3T76_006277 [Phytophthora citrophthora]
MRLFLVLLAVTVGLAVSSCNGTATTTKKEEAAPVIEVKQENASVYQEDSSFKCSASSGYSASDDSSQLDSADSEEIEERAAPGLHVSLLQALKVVLKNPKEFLQHLKIVRRDTTLNGKASIASG